MRVDRIDWIMMLNRLRTSQSKNRTGAHHE